jgi:hypothetical protein
MSQCPVSLPPWRASRLCVRYLPRRKVPRCVYGVRMSVHSRKFAANSACCTADYFAFHARNCAHRNAQTFSARTSPSRLQNVATQHLATNAPITGQPVIAQNTKFNYSSPKASANAQRSATPEPNAARESTSARPPPEPRRQCRSSGAMPRLKGTIPRTPGAIGLMRLPNSQYLLHPRRDVGQLALATAADFAGGPAVVANLAREPRALSAAIDELTSATTPRWPRHRSPTTDS